MQATSKPELASRSKRTRGRRSRGPCLSWAVMRCDVIYDELFAFGGLSVADGMMRFPPNGSTRGAHTADLLMLRTMRQSEMNLGRAVRGSARKVFAAGKRRSTGSSALLPTRNQRGWQRQDSIHPSQPPLTVS
ncbi:uncharacterized protein An16g04290 [Aspergillus niger]|uniref:Contig An16c0160, genomic contig n=2 Tax=Aspergillus niger TaxID=5061 RepID=A2R7P8_ASPNC|nr:uncharacterized protein An16g04290 [Aspergillus niger]CAK46846.1 unnamed protein product [Aspergillus niger]